MRFEFRSARSQTLVAHVSPIVYQVAANLKMRIFLFHVTLLFLDQAADSSLNFLKIKRLRFSRIIVNQIEQGFHVEQANCNTISTLGLHVEKQTSTYTRKTAYYLYPRTNGAAAGI
jgi:uncharacterized membrane protein YcgQ (UPF0703/DUF1980 family)